MKMTLHLGAHRTASSTFQSYLRAHERTLAEQGVAIWTPKVTRDGRFAGVLGDPSRQSERREKLAKRSANRVQLHQEVLAKAGMDHLLISEENFLGGLPENIGLGVLYPSVARRLDRMGQALSQVRHVAVAVRSYDTYWTSAIGFQLTRGLPMPDAAHLDCFVTQPRRWRHIIHDISATFPWAEVSVWSFEAMAARPDVLAHSLTGLTLPAFDRRVRLNATLPPEKLREILTLQGDDASLVRSKAGRFSPFDAEQLRALRAQYREDIEWLRDGADGFATYIDPSNQTPKTARAGDNIDKEGSSHDRSHFPLGRVGHQRAAGQTARGPDVEHLGRHSRKTALYRG